MSLVVKERSGDFEVVEPGTYNAVCVTVLDLGVQPGKYGDREQVHLGWELEQRDSRGERFVVSATYGASLGRKSHLRADLEAWRGRSFTDEEVDGFDLRDLAGKPALINIVHNEVDGKVFANVAGLARLPRGTQPLQSERLVTVVDGESGKPRDLLALPEWLRERAMAGWARRAEQRRLAESAPKVDHRRRQIDLDDDEIPF
jgi:hypothetical protein